MRLVAAFALFFFLAGLGCYLGKTSKGRSVNVYPFLRSCARAALPFVVRGVGRFLSLVLHGMKFCPRKPLNTTQQIGEAL